MRHTYLTLTVLLAIIFCGCEKETILTVDQTAVSFTDAGGSETVSLTTNKPWAASSNQSWCKVSPSAGEEASSSRINITCDANTTYDARNCTITFTCADKTTTVNVSQATNNGLQVSQTSYELTKAAQQLNIQVQANVKFSVDVDNGCKEWIKYNTTKGLTSSTVVLDIAENKTYDSREGKVTIKQDGGSLSSTLTIKQSQLDGLFITTPEYNLSNEKHTLTVEVSTNVEFDVKPDADWVKYVQTKGLNTKQIVLEVAENDTYDQRETKVNVKQKNGDLNGVIIIKQDEKYGILVSQSEYNLSNEAQTIDVEVKYNVDFDMVIPDNCKSWIKLISTKSINSKTYTFSIANNKSYDNREGSITFKQKNGAISTTVAIKQAQTDYLEPDKTDCVVSEEEQSFDISLKTNVDYQSEVSDNCKEWISIVDSKGLQTSTLTIHVASNNGGPRTGSIIIRGKSISAEVFIRQHEGVVQFDDANFKYYCIRNFDKNKDGEISLAEAKAVQTILVCTDNIYSLKGIENFSNLTKLVCGGTDEHWDSERGKLVSDGLITSLDLSNNTALKHLECGFTQLSNINVSGCIALTYLNCACCELTSLDVSSCTSLDTLDCCYNQLTNLNVSNHPSLTLVNCQDNCLTKLNASGCRLLKTLTIWGNGNQLTIIDVSGCPSLTSLGIMNPIPNMNQPDCSLNVSGCTALKYLGCSFLQLTSLDVSGCTALTSLICDHNQLADISVSTNTCLKEFNCESNLLTSLDVSHNTQLVKLNCRSNKLTSIDVSSNTALAELWCNNNPMLKDIWLMKGQIITDFQYDTNVATIKYK